VDTTIVDGKVVMRHHELTTLDWADICHRAKAASAGTWKRFATL
jgi:hypothetical protein